ncbi:3-deoxy-manno-octulosonate cytidylyltransferase [Membranicola marinus]|uniref:3-deoxy-manno-octulosonate cytidylyltransferase n=1 Tax=Membranihabitans marinus TaxID=1227546 RepID=A0A953LCF5_9BACT|nr:3-deoxy-manno-octulosonate cytidylyltransferase [Membranihabitans marinus]MBY5957719.1 3-deoxy-manno-octulosonate cytidylyltransferase [Membranihabitans marinus]
MSELKIIAAIPARYQSTRLPGKLMADLGGMPVIRRTLENVKNMELFDEVVVVTDSDEIESVVEDLGTVMRSQKEHACGTDRIAEFATQFDADIIFNVQGDEPFLGKDDIERMIRKFYSDQSQNIDVMSLRHPIKEKMDRNNPNYVKVVSDLDNYAMYFSRSNIPFRRKDTDTDTYRHIGIYAFRKDALVQFANQPLSPLESMEMIEALRILEMGMKIKLLDAQQVTIGIDTREDLNWANQFIDKNQ